MGNDSPAAQRSGRHGHRRRRLAMWSLVGAALLYNGWIIESAVPTLLDPRHSYVSELYAADQQSRPLFAALELTSAVLIVVGAAAWRRQGAGLGWWALIGFGASSVADVLLPLDCAPSLEPGCSAVHPLHTVTSALVHFFLFASMASLAWWAKRHPAPGGWGVVGHWGLPLMGVAMLAAVATVGPLVGHPGWHGVPQRLHLVLVGTWLLLLAYGVRAGGGARTVATVSEVPGAAKDAAGVEAPHWGRAATAFLLRSGSRAARGATGTKPSSGGPG